MANLYVTEILVLFVTWIFYGRVRYWLTSRRLRKWGEENGCGELPTVPNKLPGGIERVIFFLIAMKKLDFLEDVIGARFKQMGCYTYKSNTFSATMITTADPENIQAILATKFGDFDLGPKRNDIFFEVLGNGIFTAEREAWVHYRHQLKPQFTRDQVSDLDSADRHLNVLFKALPEVSANGWVATTDLLPFLYRFTLDVSTEFLFGQSVNSQSTALYSQGSGNMNDLNDVEPDMDFAAAMSYTQQMISWRLRLGSFAWLLSKKKFKRACKIIKDFAEQFVHSALDPSRKAPLPIDTRSSSPTHSQEPKFILLDELALSVRDPIELRDQVLQILVAGRDTTSAMLGWTIALLSRHPEEFAALRAAIIAHFGTESNPTNELTFSSLKACKQLTHVFYETLRLYPLVPLNRREAVRDTILPRGGGEGGKMPIVVPKGTQVGYPSWVLHRREDIWGKDAGIFRPGRWEGRKLGWEFIGFSGGPRVCLGQQYALNEASFVMVKLLQRFDKIEAAEMKSPIQKSLTIILAPGENGTTVRMRRASD